MSTINYNSNGYYDLSENEIDYDVHIKFIAISPFY